MSERHKRSATQNFGGILSTLDCDRSCQNFLIFSGKKLLPDRRPILDKLQV
ncbi:hypothetical protein PQG02_30665 [Nostoc sp. UHCC 0926]|uniref:hypothetical protein n=1 Tax=unclassified Nostoc TaxID=2593658 RepID=UPI0023630B88|nr:hypothetical protein [Nostoc sp. UHCC 0926]WDD32907.1 hypothetical protein PQG02_30665 [Nostoc sp. UHCC 0926]